MIVHFIGNAGTGKTTLLRCVATEGGYAIAAEGSRRWLSLPIWLLPIATLLSWRVARRLVAYNRRKSVTPGSWDWAGTIGIQKARRWATSRNEVLLLDQAMTNRLRQRADEGAAGLVSSLPLPDMVIHVSAPPAVRAARIAARNKPEDIPKQYLAGQNAWETGAARARQWNAIWGAHEAFRCLQAWSCRLCRPVLDDATLQSLLGEAIKQPLTANDETAIRCEPLPARLRWLHQAFTEQGVRWLDIVNDGTASVEESARMITQEIEQCRR